MKIQRIQKKNQRKNQREREKEADSNRKSCKGKKTTDHDNI